MTGGACSPTNTGSPFTHLTLSARTIIIGDIHGCLHEFEELLAQVSPVAGDEVVLLGDLVNRGPDIRGVVQLARTAGFRALMGNHELRLLEFRRRRDPAILKNYDKQSLAVLQEEDWHYLEQMLWLYETADSAFVAVHGGFRPGIPWRTQPLEMIAQTKHIPWQEITPSRRFGKQSRHWSEVWEGPPTVIYGHTPRPRVKFTPHALGIDTACVYGGFLTACVLPDLQIVRVRARRAYI